MKIPKRIIHRISRIIKDTSAPYSQTLPDTQRHLLPQILLGLLTASSAYASDVARKMEGTSIGAKEMRILRFVHHPKLSYDQLLEAHIQRLSSYIGDKDDKEQQLRIYGDISEMVKPWALSMDAIDTVRDGSDPGEKKKSGYWLNEVYLSPNEGRIIPVVLYPFPLKREVLRARVP
jgi:hypothetical protein